MPGWEVWERRGTLLGEGLATRSGLRVTEREEGGPQAWVSVSSGATLPTPLPGHSDNFGPLWSLYLQCFAFTIPRRFPSNECHTMGFDPSSEVTMTLHPTNLLRAVRPVPVLGPARAQPWRGGQAEGFREAVRLQSYCPDLWGHLSGTPTREMR